MKKKNTHNDLGFKVPKDYFESSVDRLFDKATPSQEREEKSFSVPSGYFYNLEDRIMNVVQDSNFQQLSRQSSFEVPQGYFESLEDRICNNIGLQPGNSGKLPFITPDQYFENLEVRVLEATVDNKVVRLKPDYPSWVIPLIAVAAIFVAVMAINGFWSANTMTLDDLKSEELAIYLAETNFTSDHDAIDILYTGTDVLSQSNFETTTIDNDALFEYLADEVEMNLMIEE